MTYPPQSPEPNAQSGPPGPAGPGPQPGASGDFATQWGIKENPDRPKKVNQFTQLLWIYAAAAALTFLFAILASATAPWWYGTGFIVGAAVFGLIIGAGAVAVAWFVINDKLGVFGAADPRIPLYVGLGVLGFFSFGGFVGGWGLGWYAALGSLLALAKLAAVALCFFLLFQPEVEQWLKSRPGNRPRPPQQPGGYTQPPPGGQQPPPPGNPNGI